MGNFAMDVVVTDLRMPDVDGLSVLAAAVQAGGPAGRDADDRAREHRERRRGDDSLFPKRFAEPHAKFFDIEPAPARRQKMAKLMHNDEQIEKDDDFENDKYHASDVQDHDQKISGPDAAPRFFARPLIGGQYLIECRMRNDRMTVHHLLHDPPNSGEFHTLFKEC